MLSAIKDLDINRLELDEAIALQAFAGRLENEYMNYGLNVPVWLQRGRETLDTIIRTRKTDDLQRRLQIAQDRLIDLDNPSKKRMELEAEIALLQSELLIR